MCSDRILQLKERISSAQTKETYSFGKIGPVERYIIFKMFIDDYVSTNLLNDVEKAEFNELFDNFLSTCTVYEGFQDGRIPDIDMIAHLTTEKIKKFLFSDDISHTISVWKILYSCRKIGKMLLLTVDDIVQHLLMKLRDDCVSYVFGEIVWHFNCSAKDLYEQIFDKIMLSGEEITEFNMNFLYLLTKWILSEHMENMCASQLNIFALKLFETYVNSSRHTKNAIFLMQVTVQTFASAGVVPDIPNVSPKLRFELFFEVHVLYDSSRDVFYRVRMADNHTHKCVVEVLRLDGYEVFEHIGYWGGELYFCDFTRDGLLRLFEGE